MQARRLAGSTAIVMLAFGLDKVIGLARQAIIGHAFGTGSELDAYYAAFNVPDLLFTLISGGALATAFLPVLATYLAQDDRIAAWRLVSTVINAAFALTLLIAIIVAVLAPALVRTLVAPGFTPENQVLTANLMRLILISTVIFAVSGLLMTVLHAHQHFLLPALAPLLYDMGVIGGALFLVPRWGVYGLAIGVIAGALLHLGIQLPGLLHYHVRWFPLLNLRHPGLIRVAALLGPRVLGLAVVKINLLITTNLASRLGEGAVSALNYGWILMQVPETIFGTAIATVVFPTLADRAARGDRDGLRLAATATLRVILALTIPAAVGLIVLGYPLIQLFLERGEFGPESTQAVYWALIFYAPGVIVHAALEVVARLFYAQQDTRTPFLVASASMLVNVLLALTLMGPLSYGGLALANSLAVGLEVGLLLLIARQRLSGIEGARLVRTGLRSLLGAGAMALAIVAVVGRLAEARPILVGLGGTAMGTLVYLAVILALGSEEVRALPQLVRQRRVM